MSRRHRLAAAVGAAVVAGFVVVPAAPAHASYAGYATTNQPNIAITSASPAGISGNANFTPDFGFNGAITDISVTVSYNGHTVSSCHQCGSTVFSLTPTGLTNNGHYSVTAAVTATESLIGTGLNPHTSTNSASAAFSVAVPPAAPHVSAVVNSDGSVTVTWSRNTEPDLIGYQVRRGGQTVVPFQAQSHSGTSLTWTDTTTNQGGDFAYVVYAFRPGADGTANSALSTASAAATASVPVPATTTLPTGVGVVTHDTTTTVAAPAGPSSPDLSAFLAQANQAGATAASHAPAGGIASAPAPRVVLPGGVGPPDTYQPTLPFGRSASSKAGSGSPTIALPGRSSSSPARSGLLYSVAGGLLLCVLGLAVRKFNKGPEPLALNPVTPRAARERGHPPVVRRISRPSGGAAAPAAGAGTAAPAEFDAGYFGLIHGLQESPRPDPEVPTPTR